MAYIPHRQGVRGYQRSREWLICSRVACRSRKTLTRQIAGFIQQITDAAGVAVVTACGTCMMMRGAEKQNSVMTSSVMLGAFQFDDGRSFLQLIGRR